MVKRKFGKVQKQIIIILYDNRGFFGGVSLKFLSNQLKRKNIPYGSIKSLINAKLIKKTNIRGENRYSLSRDGYFAYERITSKMSIINKK